MSYYDDDRPDWGDEDHGRIRFRDPGGKSALRAASRCNPRNLPCPTCKEPNRLTPADKAARYELADVEDADEAERRITRAIEQLQAAIVGIINDSSLAT